MAIRIRRRSTNPVEREIQIPIRNLIRVTIEFKWSTDAEPVEPYHQIDAFCAFCNVRGYRSGNGIDLCLVCGRPISDVAYTPPPAYPRRPFSRPRPNVRASTARTYKVKAAKPKAAPPTPPTPPSWTSSLPEDVRNAVTILSLDQTSMTVENIHRRRRELAFVHHPDRGGNTQTLASINAAADVLIDYLDL